MLHKDRQRLLEFLSPAIVGGFCGLYLPRFTDARINIGSPPGRLRYAGGTYADRDTKAALRIFGLVSAVVPEEHVQLLDASQLTEKRGFPGGFLFGSKSNPSMPFLRSWFGANHGFSFDFGDQWTVVWRNEVRYSIPDPSRLRPREYEVQNDFGIVARLTGRRLSSGGFVIAGLGGRATEGCANYLVEDWKRLHSTYKESDFCILLKFPPPINPQVFEVVQERGMPTTKSKVFSASSPPPNIEYELWVEPDIQAELAANRIRLRDEVRTAYPELRLRTAPSVRSTSRGAKSLVDVISPSKKLAPCIISIVTKVIRRLLPDTRTEISEVPHKSGRTILRVAREES